MTFAPDARGSIERDADAFFLAPDDVARPLQLVRWHKQRETVGDEQGRDDFECCAGLRNIANGAIDSAPAELDRSGLQRAVARGDSGLVHGVNISRFSSGWRVCRAPARKLGSRCPKQGLLLETAARGTLFSSGELRRKAAGRAGFARKTRGSKRGSVGVLSAGCSRAGAPPDETLFSAGELRGPIRNHDLARDIGGVPAMFIHHFLAQVITIWVGGSPPHRAPLGGTITGAWLASAPVALQ